MPPPPPPFSRPCELEQEELLDHKLQHVIQQTMPKDKQTKDKQRQPLLIVCWPHLASTTAVTMNAAKRDRPQKEQPALQ